MKDLICKLFGHAFIPAQIRDYADYIRCPRCDKWITTEEYDEQRYKKKKEAPRG